MAPADSGLRFDFFPGLDALPADSLRLWQESGVDSFFLSRGWFDCVISTGLDAGDVVAVGALHSNGGQVLALLPARFTERRSLLHRTRRFRSLTGIYACLFRPIMAPGVNVNMTARSLGMHLGAALRSSDIIQLDAFDGEWEGLPAFEHGLREAGLLSVRYEHFGNWFEEIAGRSFEQYLAARGGALREILRRKERALEKRGMRNAVISAADQLTEGIAAYEAVYSRSWKPAEPFPEFHNHLMCMAARMGVLRLGLSYIGERPIAAQIWIVWRHHATVLKLAHDGDFDQYSPGSVLLARMIRYLIENDGVTEIDFGRGDDTYKREWATRRRQRIGLLAANPRSMAGLTILSRHWLGRCFSRVRGRGRR